MVDTSKVIFDIKTGDQTWRETLATRFMDMLVDQAVDWLNSAQRASGTDLAPVQKQFLQMTHEKLSSALDFLDGRISLKSPEDAEMMIRMYYVRKSTTNQDNP